jgi:hypothetical protein
VKLGEERWDFESGSDDTFAEISDGFGYDTNSTLVFRRKKERAQEWAMNAIAEREFRIAQACEKFSGEVRIAGKRGPKQRVPVFGRIG